MEMSRALAFPKHLEGLVLFEGTELLGRSQGTYHTTQRYAGKPECGTRRLGQAPGLKAVQWSTMRASQTQGQSIPAFEL